MAVYNPLSSRATNLANLKAAVQALISDLPDGSKVLDTEAAAKLFADELRFAVSQNANFLAESDRAAYLASTSPAQSRMRESATRISTVVRRDNWVARPDWPITSTAESKEQRVAKIDSYQAESISIVHDIINYFEGKLKNLKPFFAEWLDGNMLNLDELDEDGNVVPGSFPDAEDARREETRTYIATFVTDRGEESGPSAPAEIVRYDSRDVLRVDLPAVPPGRFIQSIRLYRSSVATGAAFQFHSEHPVGTTFIANDNKAQAELQEPCPTIGWDEPPSDLAALAGMANGIMVGGSGRVSIRLSVPYHPYAWPVDFEQTLEYPWVGMVSFGNIAFIGTEGKPYFLTATDPGSASLDKIESMQAMLSARTLAAVPGGAMYASPDGLAFASPGRPVEVVTAGIYDRDQWQALGPQDGFAAYHDGAYYLFLLTKTLVFDVESKKVSTLDVVATAAFSDLSTDTLYVATGTSVIGLFGGGSMRTGTWRSGKIILPGHAKMAWLQVESSFESPVTVRIYRDNSVLLVERVLTSIEPVRMPDGSYNQFEIEVTAACRVTRVVVAETTREIQSV